MKKLSIKAVLSTLLILVFLCLAFTGALLYFGKTGVVLGISRYMLREIHFWVAVTMCALIPVHLILNLRIFRAELRSLRGVTSGKWKVESGKSGDEMRDERSDEDIEQL